MAYECLLKCGKPCRPSDSITERKWDSLKAKTEKWSGLDKYGDVFDTTPWQDGPQNYYVHDSCYITISSSVRLEKAKRLKEKSTTSQICGSETKHLCEDEAEVVPPKRLRSSLGGPLHDKSKCVWCMKAADFKHPDRPYGKLSRISTYSAWHSFRRHLVFVEDEELRARMIGSWRWRLYSGCDIINGYE